MWSLTVLPLLRDGVVVDPAALCARDDDGVVVLGVREGRVLTEVSADDLLGVVVAVLPRVHEPRAAGLVDELLAREPLAGQMDGSRRFTCYLFCLAPGAGLCGDCVLDRVPG